jgi:hypothetical protein
VEWALQLVLLVGTVMHEMTMMALQVGVLLAEVGRMRSCHHASSQPELG